MNTAKFSRNLVAIAAAALVLSPLAAYAKPRMLRINSDGTTTETTQTKSGRKTSAPTTTTSTSSDSSGSSENETSIGTIDNQIGGYLSTLSPDYTPAEIAFASRKWRVNAGATWVKGMDHSIRLTESKSRIRFEIRNSEWDRSSNDSDASKRRAELSGSIYGDSTRLPNSQSLWGAFSTQHEQWADPDGMRKLTGGVYGQLHMGSFGGSPAVAFRRRGDGTFRITTRGEFATSNTTRYEGALPFGRVHDIVYNVVLHPTAGSLKVWVNGAKVVDVANVSIGSSQGGSYWAFGAYFAGGVTSPVVAEYANHVYPSTASLSERISNQPVWPKL